LQNQPDKPITTETLYVKTDAEHRGAITHAVMQTLSNSPAQLSGQLRTPQSVLWQEVAGLHWQLALPGMALLDWDARVGSAVAARVGESLAALHATKVPVLRNAMSILYQQPRVAAELLGKVEPAWKPLLVRLAGLLEVGGKRIEREPAVTLHGDLHPRNILINEGRLAFIDLDSVRFGPAVLELGAWVADAIYRATLDGVTQDIAAPSWRAFLAAYTKASAYIVNEPLLAWSTAHNLLCQRAYRCVSNLKPGRFEVVPQLLALADVIASAGTVNAICAYESTSTCI
jgi:Ser/Thr protein kinase RdoA (MazF antagonist)